MCPHTRRFIGAPLESMRCSSASYSVHLMCVALGVQDGPPAVPVSKVAASVFAQSLVASSWRNLLMLALALFIGFFFSSCTLHLLSLLFTKKISKMIVGA